MELLHPLRTIDPPVNKPTAITIASNPVFRRRLRKPKTPIKLLNNTGHPRTPASAASEWAEPIAGRIARDELEVGTTPEPTSVQSVTPTVWDVEDPGTGANTSVVGVTVHTEFAGRPEQAKLTVPFRVLLGVTTTVASAVEPCAVPKLNELTCAWVVGEMKAARNP